MSHIIMLTNFRFSLPLSAVANKTTTNLDTSSKSSYPKLNVGLLIQALERFRQESQPSNLTSKILDL